jgi:hypothetical protein
MSYTLILAVVTLLGSLVGGLLFTRYKERVFVTSLVVTLIAGVFFFYWFELSMSPVRVALDLAVPLIIVCLLVSVALLFTDYNEYREGTYAAGKTALFVTAAMVLVSGAGDLSANPRTIWPVCNQTGITNLVGMFNITIEPEPFQFPDVNPNLAIVTDEDIAYFLASDVFGEYSSYLQLDAAQHVEVNGRPWLVVDMVPRSYAGFNRPELGGIIPGYYLIDPTVINSSAEFQSAPMSIVPRLEDSRFILPLTIDHDLERRVFNEVLQPNGWQAIGLGGLVYDEDGKIVDSTAQLELNDQMQPRYTALMVKPIVGTTGYYADAFLIVDPTVAGQADGTWYEVYDITSNEPQPGVPVVYDVSAVPAWVNNIFPEEYFRWWIQQWGEYDDFEICQQNAGTGGQHIIDSVEDKYMANGHRIYMFTLTSKNADTAMTMRLYADPRTGAVRGFETIGVNSLPNLASIENSFRQRTRDLYPPEGYYPSETEITTWADYEVFTTILKTVDATSNDVSEQSFAKYGVVLADTDATRYLANYIVADSPAEAYTLFVQQLINGGQLTEDSIEEVSILTSFEGEVILVGTPFFDGTTSRISFMIRTDAGELYGFYTQADARTSLLAVGHRVIVEVLNLDPSGFSAVTQMNNLSLQFSQ